MHLNLGSKGAESTRFSPPQLRILMILIAEFPHHFYALFLYCFGQVRLITRAACNNYITGKTCKTE